MSLVPDTESAQTGLYFSRPAVMLSNYWWDNHSSGQKVPTCGLCYFVIFVDLMADTPLEAANVLLAVGLFWLAVIVLVTGELFVGILILIFILN